MKYVFVTLLLLNLGYFGYWALAPQQAEEPRVSRSSSNTPTIQLLQEGGQGADPISRIVVSSPEVPVSRPEASCMAIGPFVDLFSSQAVTSQLTALDQQVSLRAIDELTATTDFRVLLAPAKSLQDAYRRLRELQSQQIDSYVITQGKYSLGISLGVFSRRDAADRTQSDLLKRGYQTEIVTMPRYNRQFWIFPSLGGGISIDAQVWRDIQANHTGVDYHSLPCPETKD
jgi:hypothetical protein